MKTKNTTALALMVTVSSLGTPATVSCNFDDYAHGQVAWQKDWALIRGAPNGFLIDDREFNGRPGNKALKIEFETKYSTVRTPIALSWKPGETWELEFDFMLELEAGHTTQTNVVLGLLMGSENLIDQGRWIQILGAQPDGKWGWKGGAPNWKFNWNIPANTFLRRPGSGNTESPWYHLKFTTTKCPQRNRFESKVAVARLNDGKTVLQQVYKTAPDHTKNTSSLWQLKTMHFGFTQGKASPNGVVWIDNIKASSIPPEPKKGNNVSPKDNAEDGYAKIFCKRPFTRFRNDESITVHDWGGVFDSVPEKFRQFKITQNEFNSEEPLEFTVKTSGLVYIVIQHWQSREFQRKGWTPSGQVDCFRPEAKKPRTPMIILEKHFDAGEYKLESYGNSGTQLLKR